MKNDLVELFSFNIFFTIYYYVNNATKRFSCFKTIYAIDNIRFHHAKATTKYYKMWNEKHVDNNKPYINDLW